MMIEIILVFSILSSLLSGGAVYLGMRTRTEIAQMELRVLEKVEVKYVPRESCNGRMDLMDEQWASAFLGRKGET